MKRILAIVLALVTLTLCCASCGPKDAIKIAPHDLNMPDSYEILYTVVVDDQYNKTVTTSKVVCGCDASGNFFFSEISDDEEKEAVKRLCLGSDDSYKLYEYDAEIGKLISTTDRTLRWVDAFVTCNDKYLEHANNELAKGTYEKIDTLSEASLSLLGKEAIDISDTERFEYFKVTGGYAYDGKPFETVVEKGTGACVFVNYLEPSAAGTHYYFYATKYTTPFDGSYGNLAS